MAYILKHGDSLAPGAAEKIIKSFDVERRRVSENVVAVAARLVRDTRHEASQYVGNVEKNAAYITGKPGPPLVYIVVLSFLLTRH
jgi:hypothetical protein